MSTNTVKYTPINFEDTETAFAPKSNGQLRRAYWLFRLMNQSKLVNLGTHVATWALKLHLPIKGIVRKTIYQQFCGGESVEKSQKAVDQLYAFGIQTILDYGVEAKQREKDFDKTCRQLMEDIQLADEKKAIPAISSKITALAKFDLLEKINRKEALSEAEKAAWERARQRVRQLSETAHGSSVSIYFDAEESWIQDAIDDLVMEMMSQYNKEDAIIYHTIQLYRHDRLEYLKKCYERAKEEGFILAVKLVRGAYMEKERERAAEQGYPSPIQVDKAHTDADFNAGLRFCMEHLDQIVFCNASHNQESNALLVELMQEKQIPKNHPHIYFAQLYGMSDHLSFNLADHGYNAAKYVVYGGVKDVIPYLIRRARENTSVTGQLSRELGLLTKEMKRRRLL